ncbi:MAG: Nif3-like dinuclear metal center hexameric protein [Spirochaetales bacterium]|nr:Nif3-like dinuclear metal center hexameric protein [Spirochaetales bacterium]
MTLADFDRWARALLSIDSFRQADDSLNGVQVGRMDAPLGKMAFAVDASLEAIRRASEAGAQALFVHHGLFWGKPAPLVGWLRERVAALIQSDLALYACHLPLDAHPVVGNNAGLARLLGLSDIRPFGRYHGVDIGFRGSVDPAITLEEAQKRVLPSGDPPLSVLPFGPERIRSVSVISGGAAMEAMEAIDAGVDLYVTGEPSHSVYHQAQEAGLNIIAAGHYRTEVHGPKAMAERAAFDLGLETVFLELPTGL